MATKAELEEQNAALRNALAAMDRPQELLAPALLPLTNRERIVRLKAAVAVLQARLVAAGMDSTVEGLE